MTQNSNESQIRALVEKWASAVRAKDMDGVLANHTDDIVMFDVPMPLQSKGMEEYKKTWDYSLITALEGRGHLMLPSCASSPANQSRIAMPL